MILSLLDTKVIQLINQYSINGSLIPFTEGTIEDYLLRNRNLIDDCVQELKNKFFLKETVIINQVSNITSTAYTINALPTDLMKILSVTVNDSLVYMGIPYFIQEGNMLINPLINGNIIIEYAQIPKTITVDSLPTDSIDLVDEACSIIAYYVAGHVYMEDNQAIAVTLLNEYNNKKDSLLRSDTNVQCRVVNGWNW